jgi:hypothetical protein
MILSNFYDGTGVKRKYYVICVDGGVEPRVEGPFDTDRLRNAAARRVHKGQDADDAVFWADIDKSGGLTVGSYPSALFSH